MQEQPRRDTARQDVCRIRAGIAIRTGLWRPEDGGGSVIGAVSEIGGGWLVAALPLLEA